MVIEVYVQRVNSVRMPQVVRGLPDVDCNEATMKEPLTSVTGSFLFDELGYVASKQRVRPTLLKSSRFRTI